MNIIDNKIPTAVPSETFTGEIGYRYNTGSNEKLATVSTNTVLSPNVVLHAEGLYKTAGDYNTPSYTLHRFQDLDELDDFAKALSLIHI